MLGEECNHLSGSHEKVIIVRAKSTQAEKLAVRESKFAAIRMEKREMEVVVSVSVLVVDRGFNLLVLFQ